jgi:hypothetical protein
MASRYKPLANEMSLTTANTVSNGTLIRIANDQATAVVITIAGSRPGTISILSKQEAIIEKQPTDTLAAGSAVLAVPIAYKE